MKLTNPSSTRMNRIPSAMPPPTDRDRSPKPKPSAPASTASGTCPNIRAARSPSSIAIPASCAASCARPLAAAAAARPASAAIAIVTPSFALSTRERSGSAVSVRCIVPELKSRVESHTPMTSVATQADIITAVPGTEMYVLGLDGVKITRPTPTSSVMTARAAAVQRGSGR